MIKTFSTSVACASLAVALCLTGCGDDSDGDEPTTVGQATTGDVTDPTDDPTTGDPTTGDPTTGDPTMADSSSGGAAVCATDVCATYGAAVPAVAEAITMQAAADPQFMDDFAPLVAAGDDAVQAFIDSLANFISDAYGCTDGAYTGPSMEAAHTGMDITQDEYDAFLGLIVGILADAGVPEDDINFCFAPPLVDPAFVGTIVGQ